MNRYRVFLGGTDTVTEVQAPTPRIAACAGAAFFCASQGGMKDPARPGRWAVVVQQNGFDLKQYFMVNAEVSFDAFEEEGL